MSILVMLFIISPFLTLFTIPNPSNNVKLPSSNQYLKTSNVSFISTWGTDGTNDTSFHSPWGIDTDSQGYIYVADEGNNYIKKFNSLGEFISKFGGSGLGSGKFNSPTGLAIDSNDNIFVADFSNQLIQKFNSTGDFIHQWSTSGSPNFIEVDSIGNVYVTYSSKLVKYNNTGSFIKEVTIGTNKGVATDSEDNIICY